MFVNQQHQQTMSNSANAHTTNKFGNAETTKKLCRHHYLQD